MNVESYLNEFINLEKTGEFKYGRTLDRMHRLMDAMRHPEKNFPNVITVAGSKGKSSTASMITSILAASGQTVGLYTSPHVDRWHERIQVNGTSISDHEAMEFIQGWDEVFQSKKDPAQRPTYFELMTAMAFWYFLQKKVQTVVLEVGLGGRWDATNVCDADIAVVTPLGLEHQVVLGSSLSQIAREKCGIIKPKSAVVTSAQKEEALTVIREKAKQENVSLFEVAHHLTVNDLEVDTSRQVFELNGRWGKEGPFEMQLIGKHQLDNAALAYAAVRTLAETKSWGIGPAQIQNGFRRVSCPGRLDAISGPPTVVLDGAHNDQSAQCLAAALSRHFRFRKWFVILGMLRDKDPRLFMEAFLSLPVAGIFIVPIQSHRSYTTEELVQELSQRSWPRSWKVRPCASLPAAFEKVRARADHNDGILVTGSLYLVGEARKVVTEEVCYAA